MKTITSIIFITLLCSNLMFAQSNSNNAVTDLPQKITVPELNNAKINIDGLFPESEWKGALKLKISEDFEILFLADNENLFIGLKYTGKVADYSEPLDCMTEVYISLNSTEFYNLHSSARLAEGVNKFSSGLKQAKYSLEEVNGWEANFGSHVRENNTNCKGNEYKISFSKIKSQSLKIACNILAVNFSFRESAKLPVKYSFENSDNWVELVLPNNK